MISIVIPAYNEEKRISRTLESYLTQFSSKPFEILVVLNNCTDNTLGIVQAFQKKNPTIVRFIDIQEAIGKGGAIIKGFQESKGEIIGFVDADLATPVSDVEKIIEMITLNQYDGVIASRLLKGSVVHDRGLLRSVVSRNFSGLVRFLFDFDYRDTQCGAKFFTRKLVTTMLPEITAHDMTIDVDLLLSARKHQARIKEIPTEWFDRSSSAFLGSPVDLVRQGAKMFFSLIKLKRKYE